MASSAPDFGTILVDPPWPEHGGGKVKRGADRHYPLLTTRDIPRVIMSSPLFRPAVDAHLWLWTTNNYLHHALSVISLLGFRYITNMAWVKQKDGQLQIGLGQYLRGAHELLLFGVRGRAMVPAPKDRLPSVVFAERGKHSAKPDVFYERIERVSPAPRLEMFARSTKEGWTSHGNEVP